MGKRIVQPEDIFGDHRGNFVLNKYISIPSAIHGYSLAVEYIRNWIVDVCFQKQDFFKTIYINGSHSFVDFRRFNKRSQRQILKPALSITPAINTEYNREMVDLIQGGLDMYTKRSHVKDDRFFQDNDNNLFIGLQFKEVEMPFIIKMRVRTKSQQLDLLEYTRVACRIGSTTTKMIDVDCHVPYDIILALALDVGFEIVEDADGYYHIKDIIGFLSYLNSHSALPFMYKLRTISGNHEFFIRIPGCFTRIHCLDGIEKDDGERIGSLEDNFHVEFNANLHFTVPAIFAYYSMAEHRILNKEPENVTALYQIVTAGPPEVNERGWHQFLTTQWIDDSKKLTTIEFGELLGNNQLQRVIKYNIDSGLSPAIFMDIKIYNSQHEIPIYIDWENYTININRDVILPTSDIAIYADMGYINQAIANMDKIQKDRQNVPKQP